MGGWCVKETGRRESRQRSARNLEVLLRGDERFVGGGQIGSGTQTRLGNLLAAVLYWGWGKRSLDKTGICRAIVILMKQLSFVKTAADGRCYVSD